MKTASPCHVPVVGLAMRPVPRLLTTIISPSLVVWSPLDSHSLVPSVLRKTLTVLIVFALNLPVACPSSLICILTPIGLISLIVRDTVLPCISSNSSPFDIRV